MENISPTTETGVERQVTGNPFLTNPYWASENFRTLDRRNRLLSAASLNYQVLDWLDITARVGIDHGTTRTTQIEGYGTAFTPLGSIEERENLITQLDSDIIVGINKTIKEDFGIKAFFGANRNFQRRDFLRLRGERFCSTLLRDHRKC